MVRVRDWAGITLESFREKKRKKMRELDFSFSQYIFLDMPKSLCWKG